MKGQQKAIPMPPALQSFFDYCLDKYGLTFAEATTLYQRGELVSGSRDNAEVSYWAYWFQHLSGSKIYMRYNTPLEMSLREEWMREGDTVREHFQIEFEFKDAYLAGDAKRKVETSKKRIQVAVSS